MISDLLIKNLVLIDEAHVHFEPGLTVISGETGAGKTALITALEWVLGERIDSSKVRDPAQKSLVQASFDLPPHSPVFGLLEEAGIAAETPLIIQREIQPSGKSRALISGQLAPLQLLQTLAPYLISLISQHSHQLLRSESAHLQLLDQFAETERYLAAFAASWEEEKVVQSHLNSLLKEQEKARETLERLHSELQELDSADLKEGEEEELFDEYQRILHSAETIEKSEQLQQLLSDSDQAVLPALRQAEKIARSLELTDSIAHLEQAQSSIREVLHSINHLNLETDPRRLEAIDERLKKIDQLKKRYGKTAAEIHAHTTHVKESIIQLEGLEDRILETTALLSAAKLKTEELARKLRAMRTETARNLKTSLSSALRALNIPDAEVEIRLEPVARNTSGEDRAIFFLKANRGEKAIPVHESSSGGEIARLFLALTVLLAEKNQPATMIFDEIDANVGGKTATLIGQQLKMLGTVRQVLCITHFPQVASQADHHIRILKSQHQERTIARVECLDSEGREAELTRMRG